ncbi:hypothetical protein [Vibrio penaeicida]|uniref:hypothetical protein n=1 Tax=Vibrio penaeicida TaxID=104609 RepID=UPI001CC33AD5|nr:hypothetical protein [Vibrio penaeicida]
MKFNRSLMTMAVVSAFTVMISGCNKDSNASSPTLPTKPTTSPTTPTNNKPVAFDAEAYKKQVNSAPECGEWHLPEHMEFLPQQQILDNAVLDSQMQKFIQGMSSAQALEAILSQAPSAITPKMKDEIRQCSSITTGNTVHEFSSCGSEIKKLFTKLYQSDGNRFRMICRVTKPKINIAVIPVVIDGYTLQSNSIRQEVVARFGEGSNVDKHLEATLNKNVELTVASELAVSGIESDDDNKVSLPYKNQIINQSLSQFNGSKLDSSMYDQLAFVYIAGNNTGLISYGNIYKTETLSDGTVLKNRFIINSDLSSKSHVEKFGLGSTKKSLAPDQVLFVHEYLHGLGLGHASVSPCSYKHFTNGDKVFDFGQSCDWTKTEELNKETMHKFHEDSNYSVFNYGIYNGVMGGKGNIGQEVLPYFQYRLGVVNSKKVVEVKTTKTVELYGFDPEKDTEQLIHLSTKNGHFWLWFNTGNGRFDWMMEQSGIMTGIELLAPTYGDGLTLATVSTNKDETLIIIPNDYSLGNANDPTTLRTDKSLFENGKYTIENVEMTVSTKGPKAKTIEFVFK